MAIDKVVSRAVGMLPLERGCCCLTIFETFMIMIGFASLIVAVLTFSQKNNPPLSFAVSGGLFNLINKSTLLRGPSIAGPDMLHHVGLLFYVHTHIYIITKNRKKET